MTCKGVIPGTFVACGEDPEGYGYCSEECERRAEARKAMREAAEASRDFLRELAKR